MSNPAYLIKSAVRDPYLRFTYLTAAGFYNHLPDETFEKKRFLVCFGRELDLEHPQTFNEKLQWLKLYDRRPEYTIMADKAAVRGYVADRIGEKYLVPLLGIWDQPEEIDFDSLPDEFVLKCAHDSGSALVCTGKNNFDRDGAVKWLHKRQKRNYYWNCREWPYKDVKPRILAEKRLHEKGGSLNDYKIQCYDGRPASIMVCTSRGSAAGTRYRYYDTGWQDLHYIRPEYAVPDSQIIERPERLDEMLRIARVLSAGIPEVRVDLYNADDQLYFSELTLYDDGGFDRTLTPQADAAKGAQLHLPQPYTGHIAG